MSAIHNTQRLIQQAKHERNLRRDLHGTESPSYIAKRDEVRRLRDELAELKVETAKRRGVQVLGVSA